LLYHENRQTSSGSRSSAAVTQLTDAALIARRRDGDAAKTNALYLAP